MSLSPERHWETSMLCCLSTLRVISSPWTSKIMGWVDGFVWFLKKSASAILRLVFWRVCVWPYSKFWSMSGSGVNQRCQNREQWIESHTDRMGPAVMYLFSATRMWVDVSCLPNRVGTVASDQPRSITDGFNNRSREGRSSAARVLNTNEHTRMDSAQLTSSRPYFSVSIAL